MFHNLVKFWLSFTQREQLAIIILATLLVITLSIRMLASFFISPPDPDLSKATLLLMQGAGNENTMPNTDAPALLDEKMDEQSNETASGRLRPFPFDPNTADEETLKLLGLKPSQVNNIINYRNKGGKFRTREDLKKLYSISEEEFQQLSSYIIITSETSNKPVAERALSTPPRPEKPLPTIVELNEADSMALIALPGSGPWTAYRILRYRQSLGGFVSAQQLREVRGIDSLKFEAMQSWVVIKTDHINKLRINYLDFRELIQHPYLNFDQVKSLVNHRDRKGFIRNAEELQQLQHFSPTDLERLLPYLRFD